MMSYDGSNESGELHKRQQRLHHFLPFSTMYTSLSSKTAEVHTNDVVDAPGTHLEDSRFRALDDKKARGFSSSFRRQGNEELPDQSITGSNTANVNSRIAGYRSNGTQDASHPRKSSTGETPLLPVRRPSRQDLGTRSGDHSTPAIDSFPLPGQIRRSARSRSASRVSVRDTLPTGIPGPTSFYSSPAPLSYLSPPPQQLSEPVSTVYPHRPYNSIGPGYRSTDASAFTYYQSTPSRLQRTATAPSYPFIPPLVDAGRPLSSTRPATIPTQPAPLFSYSTTQGPYIPPVPNNGQLPPVIPTFMPQGYYVPTGRQSPPIRQSGESAISHAERSTEGLPYNYIPRRKHSTKADPFVANDPFHPQINSKNNEVPKSTTFDDIPAQDVTTSQFPWLSMGSSPVPVIPLGGYPPYSTNDQQPRPSDYPPFQSGNQPIYPPEPLAQPASTYPPYSSTGQQPIAPPYPPSQQRRYDSIDAGQPLYSSKTPASHTPADMDTGVQRPDPVHLDEADAVENGRSDSVEVPGPSADEPQPISAVRPSNETASRPRYDYDSIYTIPLPAAHRISAPPISLPTPVSGMMKPSLEEERLNYPYVGDSEQGSFYKSSRRGGFFSRIKNLFPFMRTGRKPYTPGWGAYMSKEEYYADDGYQLAVTFVSTTLPREIYLNFLLRLPSLYFSRVARIFEEADLTLSEIKAMALQTASRGKTSQFDIQALESSNVPPQYAKLKSTWEFFIDSIMREWKTFNIISVLLLSAILTILQIESAASDPVIRYAALFSLICALISLLFGCVYIIRFGSMRKTYKAAEWALEAKKSNTTIWWNVWVLLAMPAIWLSWSIVLYIVCIMSFIWRTSSRNDSIPPNISETALLVIRIVISSVLGLGVIYGSLILATFSRYGEAMDRAWKRRIDGWFEQKIHLGAGYYPSGPYQPSPYYQAPYPSHYRTPTSGPFSYAVPGQNIASYNEPLGRPSAPRAPFYSSAAHFPPAQPSDSPTQSDTISNHASATWNDNVTHANTIYNRSENKVSKEDPEPIEDDRRRRGSRRRHSSRPRVVPPVDGRPPIHPPDVAARPPRDLPLIPGAPISNGDTETNAYATHVREPHSLNPDLSLELNEDSDEPSDNRVRFRSPLVSAQGSAHFRNPMEGASDPTNDNASQSALVGLSDNAVFHARSPSRRSAQNSDSQEHPS